MNYIIEGGNPLKGTIDAIPNKNSIVAIIPATIIADEPIILSNVPRSTAVRSLFRIYKSLGGESILFKRLKN